MQRLALSVPSSALSFLCPTLHIPFLANSLSCSCTTSVALHALAEGHIAPQVTLSLITRRFMLGALVYKCVWCGARRCRCRRSTTGRTRTRWGRYQAPWRGCRPTGLCASCVRLPRASPSSCPSPSRSASCLFNRRPLHATKCPRVSYLGPYGSRITGH